uniref:Uncharacterized protein n=1 Tax=Chromera velia CCMP2878 TaxID=1169474 RepID=A0A0G4GQB8_9ALVE|eukprot:Cvel_22907.t1-p1 / transcript=Cvel_22907.t1 / gene=Cvel_22907 / organism=Chromera_velia_CCMP2878 / gene_product=hypothetical protein / transcript_product=hypothetical protein / location=Cvel_scaffold2302:4982-8194(-) / protein_length=1071 / sequence_SO=supercontig / SO=protein_coding / is_pseudo=false
MSKSEEGGNLTPQNLHVPSLTFPSSASQVTEPPSFTNQVKNSSSVGEGTHFVETSNFSDVSVHSPKLHPPPQFGRQNQQQSSPSLSRVADVLGRGDSDLPGIETEKEKQPVLLALSALINHACPTAQEISALVSIKQSIGIGWVVLGFIKRNLCDVLLGSLDLSGFSLGVKYLHLVLCSLPLGPGFVETLKCGSNVCKEPLLSVFLSSLRGDRGRPSSASSSSSVFAFLKTFIAAGCDLFDRQASPFFLQPSLPSSLLHLDLSGNRLRRASMQAFSSALSGSSLASLLSLDVSYNPLGPLGVGALAEGLSDLTVTPLPLQTLKMGWVRAGTKGMEVLGKALEKKKLTALLTLDLERNNVTPSGLQHLTAAVTEASVPNLRVLVLKNNWLTDENSPFSGEAEKKDYAPLRELLCTNALRDLEELDLSGCHLGVAVSSDVFVTPGRFPKLQRLDFYGGVMGGSCLGSDELAALASGLEAGWAPGLRDLTLPDESSGEKKEGILAFANALNSGHLPHLTRWKLGSRPEINGEVLSAFTRGLASGAWGSLLVEIELRLKKEAIGEGVAALAEAIREKRLLKLQKLVLKFWTFAELSGGTLWGLGWALGGGGCGALRELVVRWGEEKGDEFLGGLAEGLASGGMPSLLDLSLEMATPTEFVPAQEGGRRFGEVLGTCGKVPCLRSLQLDWHSDASFAFVFEGLSLGRLAPSVRVDLFFSFLGDGGETPALLRCADVIRAGGLPGLRKFGFDPHETLYTHAQGAAVGEALTHSEGECLESLEDICALGGVDLYMEGMTGVEFLHGFLEGMARGPGHLRALRVLDLKAFLIEVGGVRSLSDVLSGNKVPNLEDLKLDVQGVGEEGMQTFVSALSCPQGLPPSAPILRRLDIWLSGSAEVSVFAGVLGSGRLCRLKELQIGALSSLGEIRALCLGGLGSGRLSLLSHLDLEGIHLGEIETIRVLSETLVAEKLPSLRWLSLEATDLSDEGVGTLTEAWLGHAPPPLQDLNLRTNELTTAAGLLLRAFLSTGRLPSLERVQIGLDQSGNHTQAFQRRDFEGTGGQIPLSEEFPDILFEYE